MVAETGTLCVRAIDLNSGKSFTILSNLPIGLQGFLGGPPPYSFTGVAIADGTVYISGDIDNSIRTVKLDSRIKAIPETSSPFCLLTLGIQGIICKLIVKKLK